MNSWRKYLHSLKKNKIVPIVNLWSVYLYSGPESTLSRSIFFCNYMGKPFQLCPSIDTEMWPTILYHSFCKVHAAFLSKLYSRAVFYWWCYIREFCSHCLLKMSVGEWLWTEVLINKNCLRLAVYRWKVWECWCAFLSTVSYHSGHINTGRGDCHVWSMCQ